MAAAETHAPLETGWLPTTPLGDNLLRRFVCSQAEVNATAASAAGGRVHHDDDVLLADSGGPIPYLNQAVLTRPLTGRDDAVLGAVASFFSDARAAGRPVTLLSVWPTPDLSALGWTLVGHPAMVVRSPGPVSDTRARGVEIRHARSPEELALAERIAIDGYPLDELHGATTGSLFAPALASTGLVVRLGLLDGAPVGVGNVLVSHGLVNLCFGATLPAARRRGVWEALVWSRVADAPHLPAVAYTSDHSRPGFLRMGFLPITRLTLWERSA